MAEDAATDAAVETAAASQLTAQPSTPRDVTGKKRKRKRKRRAVPPAPPPTVLGGLQERLSSYVESAKDSMAARREAAQRERRALAEMEARMREGGEGAEEEDGVVEMTLFERGALYGSLLMAPAGVPGVIVGGAVGGAAGYVAERIDQVRTYVQDAYGERVETERQNAEQMAHASDELSSLEEVRVVSADPEEAEALATEFREFLARPCNQRCADCAVAFEARNEAWASVHLGVLVCKQCAACHRSLGVSVSRIKSVVFDKWDVQTARAFLEMGNDVGRARDLARLPRGYAEATVDTDEQRRRQFIHTKYVRLRWAEPSYRTHRLAQLATLREAADPKVAKGKTAKPPIRSLSSDG